MMESHIMVISGLGSGTVQQDDLVELLKSEELEFVHMEMESEERATVEFMDSQQGDEAIKKLNGYDLMGQTLVACWSNDASEENVKSDTREADVEEAATPMDADEPREENGQESGKESKAAGGSPNITARSSDDWRERSGRSDWKADSTGDQGNFEREARKEDGDERRDSRDDRRGVDDRRGGGRDQRCYNCDGIGHISRECTGPRREGAGGGGSGNCYNCGKSGHISRDCVEPRDPNSSRQDDRMCYNCNQSGHISRECPKGGGGGGGGRACYNCNRTGHISRDCPEGRGGGGGGKGYGGGGGNGGAGGSDQRCYNCNRTGHISRECPEGPRPRGACYNCGSEGHISRDCEASNGGGRGMGSISGARGRSRSPRRRDDDRRGGGDRYDVRDDRYNSRGGGGDRYDSRGGGGDRYDSRGGGGERYDSRGGGDRYDSRGGGDRYETSRAGSDRRGGERFDDRRGGGGGIYESGRGGSGRSDGRRDAGRRYESQVQSDLRYASYGVGRAADREKGRGGVGRGGYDDADYGHPAEDPRRDSGWNVGVSGGVRMDDRLGERYGGLIDDARRYRRDGRSRGFSPEPVRDMGRAAGGEWDRSRRAASGGNSMGGVGVRDSYDDRGRDSTREEKDHFRSTHLSDSARRTSHGVGSSRYVDDRSEEYSAFARDPLVTGEDRYRNTSVIGPPGRDSYNVRGDVGGSTKAGAANIGSSLEYGGSGMIDERNTQRDMGRSARGAEYSSRGRVDEYESRGSQGHNRYVHISRMM
ncbi:hypothetical protein SARC_09751 [Sphaeroforma arctica JP610]|uniref:Uncharacterized protein n=1 Tax=Sphaeroforma arctica JP610 TaxID=667725 RepID=A0A0L0FPA0_9EUKA|nr:hypothetical protein SARC_09751 [Sphaeroforma arctica JP610]KNC77803.1 hypothetical protein SARC_09751 [Sphaeroforma arctica JP610]|eukprot:XP_014151705.1 hypothetical protein SARC_09751 [Sphaeroforma arctica JP610]